MAAKGNEDLAARIKRIEDIAQIKDVWFKWHDECTGGFNGKQAGRMEALECLTEDATIEIEGIHEPGKGPTGREEYTEFRDYCYGDAGPLPYVFQTSVADKVELNGDTAIHCSDMRIILKTRTPWKYRG